VPSAIANGCNKNQLAVWTTELEPKLLHKEIYIYYLKACQDFVERFEAKFGPSIPDFMDDLEC